MKDKMHEAWRSVEIQWHRFSPEEAGGFPPEYVQAALELQAVQTKMQQDAQVILEKYGLKDWSFLISVYSDKFQEALIDAMETELDL